MAWLFGLIVLQTWIYYYMSWCYANVVTEDCNWDRKTITTANGLQSSFTLFQSIVTLNVLYKALHPLQGISAKLQKSDLDVYDAYSKIDEQISCIEEAREQINFVWESWYKDALEMARKVGTEEKRPHTTTMQQHRSNTPAITTR